MDTASTPKSPDSAPRQARRADWTLVQLTGGSTTFRGSHAWRGRWVALNQRGEIYVYGVWADCWESAKHWARVAPPRGAAEGEDGTGWRGPVPGLVEAS